METPGPLQGCQLDPSAWPPHCSQPPEARKGCAALGLGAPQPGVGVRQEKPSGLSLGTLCHDGSFKLLQIAKLA